MTVNILRLTILLLLLLLTSGCGTTGSKIPLTKLKVFPEWSQIREAGEQAAKEPDVWLPALGAVALQFGHADREAADWAKEETILYGNAERADDWSDRLFLAADIIDWTTTVVGALPMGANNRPWWDFVKNTGLERVALGSTGEIGKSISEFDDRTACTVAHNHLSVFHLERSTHSPDLKRGVSVALTALTAGQALAEVEAGHHTPAQSLAGIALGNFASRVLMKGFTSYAEGEGPFTQVASGGMSAGWRWRF